MRRLKVKLITRIAELSATTSALPKSDITGNTSELQLLNKRKLNRQERKERKMLIKIAHTL